jgi:hypothetical protein
MHHGVSAKEVYEMSCTPAFQEQKCRDAGALSYDVTVTEHAGGATIATRRKLPTVGFPSLLRRFVPAGVTSTETITWGPADDGGARTARLAVDFHGVPAEMTGEIRLLPDGPDAATVVVDAEFTAHVPLIGRKVEGFAAPIILGVIDAEEKTGEAWAAAGR